MTLLDELQALSIGAKLTVPWDELRPYFRGLTEKQRWEAMLAWLESQNLSHRLIAELRILSDGTYATTLSIERLAPPG
ncbi:MAG: hypothetical protein ACREU9_00010 [Gammaproteobacteria bacterium]